jgi:regulator of CtrA degradation
VQPVFLQRAYDEALGLMIEARNYMAYVEPVESRRLPSAPRLRMSCESMRLTCRLTQVMAWLMTQRAVEEGELTPEEALEERRRLDAAQVCLDDRGSGDGELPTGLRSLLDRSHRLYVRVSRIEEMMLSRLN